MTIAAQEKPAVHDTRGTKERERGESKMSGRVATESLRRITRWGLQERRRRVRAIAPGRRGVSAKT